MRRAIWLTVLVAVAGCGGDDAQPVSAGPGKAKTKSVSEQAGEPVEIKVGAGPGYATFAFGQIWVGNHNDDTVVAIDPETNEIAKTVEVPGEPTGISSGFGSMWTFTPIGGGKIQRIDPEAEKVEAVIELDAPGGSLGGLVKAAGAMWFAGEDRWLLSVDPRTNRAKKMLRLPAGDVPCPGRLAPAAGALWMAYECGSDRILRIDPRRGRITATIRLKNDFANWVTSRGRRVWALTQGGSVLEVDTKRSRIARKGQVADAGERMVYGEGALWVRSRASQLVSVDPKTLGATGERELPDAQVPGGGVTTGAGAVWATNFDEGTVWRLAP